MERFKKKNYSSRNILVTIRYFALYFEVNEQCLRKIFLDFGTQLEKIDDCIEFIKSRPRPLTIYAFTKNEKLKRRLISETSSGSLTFNDAIIQVRQVFRMWVA